ncbi:glycine zipper family protein [Lutimonas sp.]|uniref:glycine zipper family protein n=1 Tax=Lutimonas sp. TaxID=1872403 RepID=UPI003C76E971
MKKYINLMILGLFLLSIGGLNAQSISQSLGLYVFPANDQNAATQEADETACFKWAKEQSGYDPMNPTVYKAAEVDRSADGSMVRGGARGAAGGAAIGAIAGDAGKGAAIGAVLGGIRGRRSKVVGDEMQQQANNQAASQATQAAAKDYNKAFTVCMEGKGYTVK